MYSSGVLTSNRVQFSPGGRIKNGLGGALFLGNTSYIVEGLQLSNNSAFFGGALFTSCNFSEGGVLQNLSFGVNSGLMGER